MELEELRAWVENELYNQRDLIYSNEATVREAITMANECVRMENYGRDTHDLRDELISMMRNEMYAEFENFKQMFTRELVREIAEEFLKDVQVLCGT